MHLRRLRQAQSLTLAQLADQVGVTASALSQIERGIERADARHAVAPRPRAQRLAVRLLRRPGGADRRRDPRRRPHRRRVRALPLRGDGPQRAARHRPLHAAARARRRARSATRSSHAGEEAGMVVEGSMDVIVAGASYRLGPGDAIWFVSGQPHTFVGGRRRAVPERLGRHDPRPRRARRRALGVRRAASPGRVRPATPARCSRRRRAPSRSRSPAASRIDAGYLRERRRAPRRDRLEPARLPRHRHARGPRGRGVRRGRAARDSASSDVAIEEVAVDGWRFESAAARARRRQRDRGRGARRHPADAARAASRRRVVDAGGWRRRDLDRLDVRGALVLVDWRKGPALAGATSGSSSGCAAPPG